MIIKTILTIAFPYLLMGPLSPPASNHAYLDPGSGSFILQILLASLLASLFFFKSFWKKVLSFFRKSSSKNQETSEESNQQESDRKE